MPDIKNYKAGDVLYYLGRTKCTVIANTLKPGGVNADEAVLFLATEQGGSVVVPVAFQERFVSEIKIPFLRKWPLVYDTSN